MTGKGGAIVSLRDVGKTFDNGTVALAGLSLDVSAGEFVSLRQGKKKRACPLPSVRLRGGWWTCRPRIPKSRANDGPLS